MSMPRYQVQLRYSDTDQMGIIYFSRHLVYADEAIMGYLRDHGVDVLDLERRGVYMAVAAAHCEYEAPLRYGDACEVEVKLAKVGNTSITFEFQVYGNGSPVSRGYIVYVLIDGKGGKVRVRDAMPSLLTSSQP